MNREMKGEVEGDIVTGLQLFYPNVTIISINTRSFMETVYV